MVEEVKKEMMPRKKFAFKRKAKENEQKNDGNAKTKDQKAEESEKIKQKTSSKNDLVIKNVHSKTIRKTAEEYEGKENVILDDIVSFFSYFFLQEDCEIFLPFTIKSIYAKKLTGVKVYVGIVTGATFINDCKQSQIHL